MNNIDKMPVKCRDCAYWEIAREPYVCRDCESRMERLSDLSRPKTDDYIKRSDVLKAARYYKNRREENHVPSIDDVHLTEYQLLAQAINSIPAANVEPKRLPGFWIPCDYVVYDGKDEILHYPGEGITCSRCRCSFRERYLWRRNYCPSCGAEMRDEPPKEDNDE